MNDKVRRTRRTWFALLAGAVIVVVIILLNRPVPTTHWVVGIIEPMQHIAVSDITRGIKDSLSARDNVSVLVENANNDAATFTQIISNYRDRNVRVYVPIFTKTTQIVRSAISDYPIVFAAVTDPVAAGVVEYPDHPEGNVTGVSDLWPIGAQLDLIRRILPSARKIGVVYDPGDASSAVTMPILVRESPSRGFELETRPVHSASEIAQSLSFLKSKVDLIFTANDVTVTAAFPALVTFAVRNNIPLFAGDYSSVQRGAIAATGQNYYTVGVQTAKIINKVIEGAKISSLSVSYTTGGDIFVNLAAAEQMGVTIPADVIENAKSVYTEISEE